MTTRRLAKASEAIRETVSTTILFEMRDPRVKNVTVLRAEAAADLRTAKVYISVMGTPKEQSLCMHGLESARGFIQAKLADRLQTRYTPVLKFVLDPGVKRSIEASRLLRGVLPVSDADADMAADDAGAEDRDEEAAELSDDAVVSDDTVDDSKDDDSADPADQSIESRQQDS